MRVLAVPAAAAIFLLTACGGSGTPTPPAPTPTPSIAGCPTSGAAPSSVAVWSAMRELHRAVAGSTVPRFVPDELAVTYARGASPRIIVVDPANVDAQIKALRATPGVRDVARVSYAARQSITANDPYYAGQPGTTGPYYESSSIPGQWDMHVINMDGAWSQFASAPVIAAPIAVVDTGADLAHPELVTPSGVTAPKVVRTQCYVTFPTNGAQSSGPYVTDTDGHGTNVTGIADSDTNNSFGFAGVAFDAPLLVYRIFPSDPPGGCQVQNPPNQCFTTSADEASAIDDAVAHGARVINLSLGAGGPCQSNDPEYVAVEHAIANGVVVVAAAGNGSGNPPLGLPALDCPAADPGVIAVGASALNDDNPLSIFEYVASYSNYLSTTGTANGGAYLVAPGGDPSSSSDFDDLHWIQNIYSSDAYDALQGKSCNGGLDSLGERNDCTVDIAGTSQATPHVTGVVSLMLAKNPNLTPAQIATGLCASADPINDRKEGCGRLDAAAAVSWAATH